ncbi:MAG: type secretion chaperone SycD/LcrH [Chlamydiia bacterium]|nr:type secretion chaperone SycD/LcrH [Chlamydiia bacterium]
MKPKKLTETKTLFENSQPILSVKLQEPLAALMEWFEKTQSKGSAQTAIPSEQQKKFLQTQVEKFFSELYSDLQQSQKLIKQQFEREDSAHQHKHEDDSFTVWEKATKRLQLRLKEDVIALIQEILSEPIQDVLLISPAFTRRVFKMAEAFFTEKKYIEAEQLYFFLRMLNPSMLEYWLGEAIAEQAQKKFEDAISRYLGGLFLDPKNPLLFFQMAVCFFDLAELTNALQSIDLCIRYAGKKKEHAQLLIAARQVKQAIQNSN